MTIRSYRRGFTLIELMIALALGLLVSGLAAAAFSATQKFARRVETLAARTEVVQSLVLWTLAKQGAETAYPAGRQSRQLGGALADPGGRYLTGSVVDFAGGSPVVASVMPLPGMGR